jgi:hypothetical protein
VAVSSSYDQVNCWMEFDIWDDIKESVLPSAVGLFVEM